MSHLLKTYFHPAEEPEKATHKFCVRSECGQRFDRPALLINNHSWGARKYCSPSCAEAVGAQRVEEAKARTRANRKPRRGAPVKPEDLSRRGAAFDQAREVWVLHGVDAVDAYGSVRELLDRHAPGWVERGAARRAAE